MPANRYYRRTRSPPEALLVQGPVATIVVGHGPDKGTFFVHEALLSFYSTYFDKTLRTIFAAGCPGKLELSEDKPAVFACLSRWLYTGNVLDFAAFPSGPDPTDLSDDATQEVVELLSLCIDVWLFGQSREIPGLQNQAINAFRYLTAKYWVISAEQIADVYKATTKAAKLRRFLVEVSVGTGHALIERLQSVREPPPLEDEDVDVPLALIGDCYMVLRKKWLNGTPPALERKKWLKQLNLCPYHEHEEGWSCVELARRYQ